MAKTNRFGPKGAIVEYNTDPAVAPDTLVGLATSIKPPSEIAPAIDLTGLDDPASVGIPGIDELDEVPFTEIWDPGDSSHTAIEGAKRAGTLWNWRFTFTGFDAAGVKTATCTFQGTVLSYDSQPVTRTEGLTREVVILRASEPVWAVA